jgi:hypothetical protein
MDNKCIFCKKTFSSKSILKTHINSAKYCSQNRPTDSQHLKVIFKCEGCSIELTSKQTLDNHKSKCIEFILKKSQEEYAKQIASLEKIISEKDKIISEKDKIISEKDNHIKELEGKLENIALKAISYNYMDEDPRIIEIYQDEIPTSDLQSEIIKQDQEDEDEEDKNQEIDIKQSLEPLNLGDDYVIEYRDEDGFLYCLVTKRV